VKYYYVLTQLGRETIPRLREIGKDSEADILEYLDKPSSATVEQLADAMHLDEGITYDKLRWLSARRLVWQKTTKFVQF